MTSSPPAKHDNTHKAVSGCRTRELDGSALAHAVRLIYRVCCLAGSAALIDEIRREKDGVVLRSAIRRADTAVLFDRLTSALSYQGISDRVARDYMDRHGRVTWRQVARNMARRPSCPKLQSYWHFHGCRYDKGSRTCAEPGHIAHCPVPTHDLRNGRLNQSAYSLFLFVRDIADGDLVGWIDARLQVTDDARAPDRVSRMRAGLLEPLRHVYGVSDKTLTMALSSILIAAPKNRIRWTEVGLSMVAVDTLVHNFLHRTGILRRFQANHAYGQACYRPAGCADIIQAVAQQIDAREFNPRFSKAFPRFVQHAIWRYCAQEGLDVCNGNRIDDRKSCQYKYLIDYMCIKFI